VNNGHEVFFVGLYNPPKHILSAKGAINLDLNSKQTYFSFRILFKLIKLLWKEKPAIVQANGSDTLKYAVLAKFFSPRTKIIYRNISIVSTWIKKGSFIYFFNKWLFNKVDFVTSVGEEAMNDFIQTYSFSPAKIKVINRGVPYFQFDKIQEKQKLSNEFRFDQNNLLMVHVGQFSPEKNHAFLIDCFEGLVFLRFLGALIAFLISRAKRLNASCLFCS
jgi:glycosyltransferase involved in cell wall biosynthesis